MLCFYCSIDPEFVEFLFLGQILGSLGRLPVRGWTSPKVERYKTGSGVSLVVQWLKIRLPMQGTQLWALVREDPTCHGATKPMRHNYWACALDPVSHNYWSPHATTTEARVARACALQREAITMRSPCTAMKNSPCSLQLEKAHVQQQRPNAAKNK